MDKITVQDIEKGILGFSVPKIKKLSDDTLREIEEKLSEEFETVRYANIEEYRFLTVTFSSKYTITEKELKIIARILNNILKHNTP